MADHFTIRFKRNRRFKPHHGYDRRQHIAVIDSCRWPSWFVRPVLEWLTRKVDFRVRGIVLTLRHTERLRHGHAGGCRATISTQRCPAGPWPKTESYWRYKWAERKELRNALEQFVHIVAHELRHLDRDNRGISRQGREHDADHWAFQRVDDFRRLWPDMRRKILEKHRTDRACTKAREVKAAAAKEAKETKQRATAEARTAREKAQKAVDGTTEAKLEKAEAKLAEWLKRARHAETHAKKYRRKIRALHAAQTRKAKRAASPANC